MQTTKTIFVLFILVCSVSMASVEALFHPYDPTLEKIADKILHAQHHVDIAMYNIDVVDESPIIRTLKSEIMQQRLTTGDLSIRMIFEGYATTDENLARMEALEKLGIDVRYLNSAKKVHHKFAAIDSDSANPVLISGSANWSIGSRRNYNENILFIENEPNITSRFQNEFNLLWQNAEEFGHENHSELFSPLSGEFTPNLQVFFNSQNFHFEKGNIRNGPRANGYFLTRRIVEGINRAQVSLKIATTRFKLAPVYEAILRAVHRGVKIQIVLSMEEYSPFFSRSKAQLKPCLDLYSPKCSSGIDFSVFIANEALRAKNIELRIKYFSLNPEDYLLKQMHNKYVIVDDRELLTGSFNWSNASEWDNIENLIYLNTQSSLSTVEQFKNDFSKLWNLNRDHYNDYVSQIQSASKGEIKINCSILPMVLSEDEIDRLMYPIGSKKSSSDFCQH